MFLLFWIVIGSAAVVEFWRVELISKELYGFEPVVAESYTVNDMGPGPQLNVQYSYNYNGVTYEGHQLSPYNALTVKVSVDETSRRWITRPDNQSLIVFVDPTDPARSSLIRGWARDNRIEGFAYGIFLVTLGLGGLHLIFRPSNRVQDLF